MTGCGFDELQENDKSRDDTRELFVYKIKDENTFVSYEKRSQYQVVKLHVDINIVENGFLDITAFKKWRRI